MDKRRDVPRTPRQTLPPVRRLFHFITRTNYLPSAELGVPTLRTTFRCWCVAARWGPARASASRPTWPRGLRHSCATPAPLLVFHHMDHVDRWRDGLSDFALRGDLCGACWTGLIGVDGFSAQVCSIPIVRARPRCQLLRSHHQSTSPSAGAVLASAEIFTPLAGVVCALSFGRLVSLASSSFTFGRLGFRSRARRGRWLSLSCARAGRYGSMRGCVGSFVSFLHCG